MVYKLIDLLFRIGKKKKKKKETCKEMFAINDGPIKWSLHSFV